MKLIESSVQIIEEKDPYKMIELAGRTCYRSLDKITEDSAKEFVDRMIKLGHGAMLEHGTIYLSLGRLPVKPIYLCETPEEELTAEELTELREYLHHSSAWRFYDTNKYSKVKIVGVSKFVTTNMRVLVENKRLNDLKWATKPTQFHEKRITAKFICDRGISHEFVRHRVFSFAQESTRYCNYSKDKFENELTFIRPSWWSRLGYTQQVDFETFLEYCGEEYLEYIRQDWKPQEARQILPNALKTELVMTGFESDWEHFFKLRCSDAAHPDAKKLADELKESMNVKNIKPNNIK